jgi:hypothetical protein
VVAAGPPEQVAEGATPTAPYLADELRRAATDVAEVSR